MFRASEKQDPRIIYGNFQWKVFQVARCQRCRETFTPLMSSRLEEDDAQHLPVLCERCRFSHYPPEELRV